MVAREVVVARSVFAQHHVDRLIAKRPILAKRLEKDEDYRDAVLMPLVQAIQACIDLAIHVCAHESLDVVDTPAGAFAVLAREGIIPRDLSFRMSGAAGLRNIVVHRYGDLLFEKVAKVVNEELGDLESFLACIARHARCSAGEGGE
jgi:uncharacterized protein YutE (UPF0331/DUF86 family)